MREYEVVAVNGRMARPIGWSLPIVRKGDKCHVMGDTADVGFPARDLDRFAGQGLIRVLERPEEFTLKDSDNKALADIEYCEGLFPENLYVFYSHQSLFEEAGIGIADAVTSRGRPIFPKGCGDDPVVAYLVEKKSLIHVLKGICDNLHDCISEQLATHDWARNSSINNERLKLLTQSYYDLAYNRVVARRAIVRRALLIQRSANSDVLTEWLHAASRRWGFGESLDFWSQRMDSVICECVSLSYKRICRAIREILAKSPQPCKVPSVHRDWNRLPKHTKTFAGQQQRFIASGNYDLSVPIR